ncbi:MAG TPA: hypothetical protein VLB86_11200 [Gaiellaceae bacterium]|nr:hypothetical protein [Gaiellaceae bacterium]
MRAYAIATLVLSALIALLGVVMLVVTAARGGGATGFLLGALFVLAGAGRLWVQTRA